MSVSFSRKRLVGFDQYDRDIVLATILIGQSDQLFGGLIEIGAKRLHEPTDIPIIDHVAQTIQAEQIDILRRRYILM